MKQITTVLQEQLRTMEPIIRALQEDASHKIPGSLQIRACKGKSRYYRATCQAGSCVSKYLSAAADFDLIRRLAQQSYDRKFLHTAIEQSAAIRKFLKVYRENALTDLFADLSEERRELVRPHLPDLRRFVDEWSAVIYKPGRFDPEKPVYYTDLGEKVRSKSEKIIADRYHSLHLPYRYEYPLVLNIDGKHLTMRPDFTVLNPRTDCEFYHEHLGMLDDPAYLRNALLKLDTYKTGGIFPGEKLLLTYETSDKPFDSRQLDLLIDKYLR